MHLKVHNGNIVVMMKWTIYMFIIFQEIMKNKQKYGMKLVYMNGTNMTLLTTFTSIMVKNLMILNQDGNYIIIGYHCCSLIILQP